MRSLFLLTASVYIYYIYAYMQKQPEPGACQNQTTIFTPCQFSHAQHTHARFARNRPRRSDVNKHLNTKQKNSEPRRGAHANKRGQAAANALRSTNRLGLAWTPWRWGWGETRWLYCLFRMNRCAPDKSRLLERVNVHCSRPVIKIC